MKADDSFGKRSSFATAEEEWMGLGRNGLSKEARVSDSFLEVMIMWHGLGKKNSFCSYIGRKKFWGPSWP